jgi:hypothetical protein
MNISVDLGSVWRGIKAMKKGHDKVTYAFRFLNRHFWVNAWTPIWHDGRGPYISIGLWLFAFYRGY